MRVRNCRGPLSTEDKSLCFLLSRCVLYLRRLLNRYPKLDYEILEAIHWGLGSEIVQEDLLPLAVMLDTGERRRRFERELQEEIHNSRDFAHLMDQALRKTRRNEQLAVIDLFRGLLNKRLDQLQYSGTSDIEKNLNLFQQMFGLSELEKELCLFFLVVFVYEEAQSLFEHHLRCANYAGRGYLAAALNTTPSDISKSLNGKLSQIGILESGRGGVCLEGDFLRILQNTDEANIDTEFFKRSHPDSLSLDAHNVEGDATRHALSLLARENDKGCALLLYGNPGVGKTSYAYGLGQALGLDIYICKHEGKEKDWQRRAALMASANMVSQNPKSLLILKSCTIGSRAVRACRGIREEKCSG